MGALPRSLRRDRPQGQQPPLLREEAQAEPGRQLHLAAAARRGGPAGGSSSTRAERDGRAPLLQDVGARLRRRQREPRPRRRPRRARRSRAAAIELAREAVDAGLHDLQGRGATRGQELPEQLDDARGRDGLARPRGAQRREEGPRRQRDPARVRDRGRGPRGRRLPPRRGVRGPGGFPVGAGGHALSPPLGRDRQPRRRVALAQARPARRTSLYFHAFPYTGDKAKEKVLSSRASSRAGRPIRLFVLVSQRREDPGCDRRRGRGRAPRHHPPPLHVSARRQVAALRRHKLLVTGEALGQVASQTPENLRCVEVTVPDTLVLRPLDRLRQARVIARRAAIGTFETSIAPLRGLLLALRAAAPGDQGDARAVPGGRGAHRGCRPRAGSDRRPRGVAYRPRPGQPTRIGMHEVGHDDDYADEPEEPPPRTPPEPSPTPQYPV